MQSACPNMDRKLHSPRCRGQPSSNRGLKYYVGKHKRNVQKIGSGEAIFNYSNNIRTEAKKHVHQGMLQQALDALEWARSGQRKAWRAGFNLAIVQSDKVKRQCYSFPFILERHLPFISVSDLGDGPRTIAQSNLLACRAGGKPTTYLVKACQGEGEHVGHGSSQSST